MSLISPSEFKSRSLEIVGVLADPAYQTQLWIEGLTGCWGSMDETIAQLFDDLDARLLVDTYRDELGSYAVELTALLNAIDVVYMQLPTADQSVRLESPQWARVVNQAQRIVQSNSGG